MAPSKKQHQNHNLLSKTDIAKALGMTSQTFSNRQTRDDKFPAPTYSNRSGSVALYTPEDAKKVYDYCTRAERERLEQAEKMFASLTSGEVSFEDVELPIVDVEEEAPAQEEAPAPKEAPAPAPAKEEAKAPAPSAEEKAAADKKAADAAAEKAAKQKATEEKIKAADAKIAADKAAANKTATPKVEAPKVPAQAPAKGAAQPAKTGNGAAFGIK